MQTQRGGLRSVGRLQGSVARDHRIAAEQLLRIALQAGSILSPIVLALMLLLIARADYVQSESQGLLDRLFEGKLEPLISHFAQYRDLKPAELERLKSLIEDIEKNGR